MDIVRGFGRAQEAYDNAEPGEVGAVEAYRNTLGLNEQAIVCREYIDYCKGWSLYQDWRMDKQVEDTASSVTSYVEQLPGFFDWIAA